MAAEVARHASHILHSSYRSSGWLFSYDRRTAHAELPVRTAQTNLEGQTFDRIQSRIVLTRDIGDRSPAEAHLLADCNGSRLFL